MFLKKTVLFLYQLGIFLLCIVSTAASGEWDESKSAQAVVISVVSNALVRTDEALINAVSKVNTNKLKGDVAEGLTDRFLKKTLRGNGSWEAVSLSNRLQGLDGLYVKYNSKGQPTGLLVSEVKYGQSKLGASVCGKQLSDGWIRCGLDFESRRHNLAGQATSLKARPRAFNKRLDLIEVNLRKGGKGYFWREGSGPFSYEGPTNTLNEAKRITQTKGAYLDKASRGQVAYRTNLIKVDAIGDRLNYKIGKDQHSLKDISVVFNKYVTKSQQKRLFQEKLTNSLMQSHQGMSAYEARRLSQQIVNRYTFNEVLNLDKTLKKESVRNHRLNSIRSAKAGAAIGLAFEVASQWQNGEPNYSSLIANTGIASASSALGTYTNQKYLEASFRKQLQTKTQEHNLRTVKGNKAGISHQAFRRLPGITTGVGLFELASMIYDGDFSSRRGINAAITVGASYAGNTTEIAIKKASGVAAKRAAGTVTKRATGMAARAAGRVAIGAVTGYQAGQLVGAAVGVVVGIAADSYIDELERSKILEEHAKLYSENGEGLQTLVSRYIN